MKYQYRVVLFLLCAYATAAPGVEPYDIRAFGSFQRMSHTGDTRGAVKLTDITPRAGSYGVGALAGLRGEILLWDGKMLVTRGHAESGGSAPAPGHASSRVFDRAGVTGVLLGFHSGAGLEGVITHPGERFHVHYSDPGFRFSGHVDEYRVAKGAVLALPRN